MKYILILGVIVVVLSFLKEQFLKHKYIGTFLIVSALSLIIFKSFWKLMLTDVIMLIAYAYIEYIKTKNEKELYQYLNDNCKNMGHVNSETWLMLLPEFAIKKYVTSFETITNNFTKRIEKQYIQDDEKLSWFNPVRDELKKYNMRDVRQLEKILSNNLKYTHSTPNAKLIYDAMENLQKVKIVDGKHVIERVPMDDIQVRKQLNLKDDEAIPEYYKVAYKINDDFAEIKMESEEISIADL